MPTISYQPHFWEREEYSVVCNVHDKAYPLHSHEYNELFLILEGSLIHQKNGKTEKIGQRSLCLMRQKDIHSFKPGNKEERFVIINCEFSDRIVHDIEEFMVEAGVNSPASGWSGTLRNIPPDIWHGLVDKARRLAYYYTQQDTRTDVRRVLFKTLLIDTFTLLSESEAYMTSNPPRWLSRLREKMYKEENFIAGLPRLLELSGYGQEYVGRMMRQYYDETPTELINRLRIQKAAKMFSEARFDAYRIMIECGFNHYSWFHRCFKRYFGMSPNQFLKISKGNL